MRFSWISKNGSNAPVTLPPGRRALAMYPWCSGSIMPMKTMGIFRVNGAKKWSHVEWTRMRSGRLSMTCRASSAHAAASATKSADLGVTSAISTSSAGMPCRAKAWLQRFCIASVEAGSLAANNQQITTRFRGRRADGCRAHVPRLLYRPEHDLVVLVGIRQQFIVVDLHDERNPVRIFTRHRPQHTERRGYRVAAAFDGEFDDLGRVEIIRVLGERRARRVLDALVYRQNGQVARARQPPVVEHLLQAAQHL